jgi:hypothetical protein
MAPERLRESVIAGSWYTSDPALLKKELVRFLERATPPRLEGELTGLVVPHAGYIYSGGVAAWSYKLLYEYQFDRVLILAPSHHASFPAASIYNLGGYRTPLGTVPLDRELIEELYKHVNLIRYVPNADSREHSLETVLPAFRLTPVIMGSMGYDFCVQLAEAIAGTCSRKRVLIIASSDLSHYYPYEEATRLDRVCLDRIDALDPQGLAADLEQQRTQACGGGPLITTMLATARLGADRGKVLNYANSGDVTGDRSGVVGYAAAAFYRSDKDGETGKL